MKVLDPGHEYRLSTIDDPYGVETIALRFVKREGEGYPGNVGHYSGTIIQEALRACIDRLKYVNNQIPDDRNIDVAHHLRCALFLLEDRAAERHGKNLGEDVKIVGIENLPVGKNGHLLAGAGEE
jgi:hypothetical protein